MHEDYDDAPEREMTEAETYAWCVGIYGTFFLIVYYMLACSARVVGKKPTLKLRKVAPVCYAIPAVGGAAFWAAGEFNTRLES